VALVAFGMYNTVFEHMYTISRYSTKIVNVLAKLPLISTEDVIVMMAVLRKRFEHTIRLRYTVFTVDC